MLIAGFGRKGHAVGDIPGECVCVCVWCGIPLCVCVLVREGVGSVVSVCEGVVSLVGLC